MVFGAPTGNNVKAWGRANGGTDLCDSHCPDAIWCSISMSWAIGGFDSWSAIDKGR